MIKLEHIENFDRSIYKDAGRVSTNITTINIDPENVDIENLKQEDEKIINIIKNMKFEGIEQEFDDKIDSL